MAFVDTNIVLRYLLGDNPVLTKQAEELVAAAKQRELIITDVVVAELVYVLRATGRDREQTVTALELIMRTPSFVYENEEIVQEIMGLIGMTKLDFADCYLIVRAIRTKSALYTYDKAMKKVYKGLIA